ncbi:MAG: hypothetical protein R2762_13055 [Bryobacteraceae bacterium]
MSSQNGTKQVLYVGASDREFGQLEEILSRSLWSLHRALNCDEAAAMLRRDPVPVVLAEFENSGWNRLLEQPGGVSPNLIVCAEQAQESTWSGVLASGGFDVLEMPFDELEVLRALDVAEWDWNRRSPATAAS